MQYVRFVCPVYVFTHFDVCVFHKRMVESCVLARMNREFGVNLTCELMRTDKPLTDTLVALQ